LILSHIGFSAHDLPRNGISLVFLEKPCCIKIVIILLLTLIKGYGTNRFRKSNQEGVMNNKITTKTGIYVWIAIMLIVCFSMPRNSQAILYQDYVYGTNADGTVSIIQYFGFDAALVIPNTINGMPVTQLEGYSFSRNRYTTSVTIPGSVTNIGDAAFGMCTSLTNAVVCLGVANMGNGVFFGCDVLSSVTLPSSLTTMGYQTFANCTNLSSVYCKGTPPNVSNDTFSNATNAVVYYLPGTRGWDSSFQGQPTTLWLPKIVCGEPGQVGFNVEWAQGMTVVVETCTNLEEASWCPMQTNMLTSDSSYFCDENWAINSYRFYRVKWSD
jgi:hypothetical protein